MFWKKKKQNNNQDKIILGMVMLQDENSFDLNNFLADFKDNYDGPIDEPAGDNSSAAFKIDGELVAIGYMPFPIPDGDIKETAEYAYNWETVVEDLKSHKSHIIVTIMNGGQKPG